MNCPKCGKELNPGDKFCMGCGTKIEGNDANQGFNAGAGNPNLDAVNAFADKAFNGAKNTMMGTGKNGVNRMLRRYFFGFGDIMWLSVIAWIIFTFLKARFGRNYYAMYMGGSSLTGFGVICTIIQVIAVIGFIGAFVFNIYFRVIGMGQNNVDAATQNSIAMLKDRALNKFNVDSDQIKEVEPIVISGQGDPSDIQLVSLGKRVKFLRLRKIHTKDPVAGDRAGLDRIPRYLLVQTTVYAFTDSQLLVYKGNVDIATGTVYKESVNEIFYKDVNCVLQTDRLRKFKMGLFRKSYYTMKELELNVCGKKIKSSFDLRIAPNAESSLAGMESYIREKKF